MRNCREESGLSRLSRAEEGLGNLGTHPEPPAGHKPLCFLIVASQPLQEMLLTIHRGTLPRLCPLETGKQLLWEQQSQSVLEMSTLMRSVQ